MHTIAKHVSKSCWIHQFPSDSVLFFFFLLSVNIVDPSKDAPFKVAPSKWEAVDEAELESQGEAF